MDIIDNFEEYQEQFHLLIRFVKKNAPSHWIDVSNQSQYRIESGRLSTHLGPSWKRKCVRRRRIRPSFLSPPKESGSRIFSTPLPLSLSLSLPPRPSHPYTLSCPTSQRNPHNDRSLTSACRPIDLLPLSLTTLLTRRIIRINSRFEEEGKSRRRSLKERRRHFLDRHSLFRAMYLKKRGTFLVSRQRNSVFFEFKMNCILR